MVGEHTRTHSAATTEEPFFPLPFMRNLLRHMLRSGYQVQESNE
jgi:hypothetical protein